ncbi:MocR-like pyridoxine biosynthesis transcription factor PdxR [Clostridium minihomine]|uniref:MocR-like pyridoxine biosynthesis transcription factor PdxR n=1 Tax=Clostridium minihomine TaxID=2045012 RepID=UPI000C778BBB|nr:PLP-dependent aminotransferase family protein [Clostridium minihomine]
MLTYDLSSRGNTPLYDSLYQKMKADILQGKLKAGEKLPSKRSLAQHLKISVVTVENAYAQLILEGYLYSEEKRGYYVSVLEQSTPSAVGAADTEESQSGEEQTAPPGSQPVFLDLTSNSICSEKFPFSVWSRLMRQVLSERSMCLLEPLPFNGAQELRNALADYLYRFRGMAVTPSQIIIGAGAEYLYGLIIQLLGRKHVFAVENPGYQKIPAIYRSHQVKCRPIDLDSEGMSVSQLRESDASVVHISPSHHFPTGIVMPIKRRQEILKWANEKSERFLIEDDYDSEFRFSGRPIPTLYSIDTSQKVIYMNTFSKSLAPSIRISYMVLPDSLAEQFREKLSFYACTVPSFEQYTLARFIARGYFEQHISRMRNFYKTQRDETIQAIRSSPLANQVTILEEDAGLHFLLRVNTQLSDRQLKQEAEKHGVQISCLSEYDSKRNQSSRHILVINYSGADRERMAEGVRRLSQALGFSAN